MRAALATADQILPMGTKVGDHLQLGQAGDGVEYDWVTTNCKCNSELETLLLLIQNISSLHCAVANSQISTAISRMHGKGIQLILGLWRDYVRSSGLLPESGIPCR